MNKIRRVLRCNHCGAVLQADNPEEEGYIRRDVFEYTGDRILYCDKCYDLKMINIEKHTGETNHTVCTILRDAEATDSLVVYVIDAIAFNGTLKPDLVEKLKRVNVLVIVNKCDLLPEKAKEEHIKDAVNAHFEEYGIKPVDVLLISANKNYRIEELKEKLEQYRNKRDIYMIGSVISGKTTIIDKLLMNYNNKTNRKIEQVAFPGTKSNVLVIPIDNSSNLYELPGLELNDSVLGIVEKSVVNKYIIAKKSIKERKFRLGEDDSLVIGGLAVYTNKSEQPIELKACFSENVELKKVGKKGLTLFFKTNLIKRELRPISENLQQFENFDLFQIETDNSGEEHEIAIKGLGWVDYKAQGNIINVLTPRGAGVKEGKSRI